MPFRSYKCQECGNRMISRNPISQCSECFSKDVKLVIRPPKARFFEKIDGKSSMVDSDRILKERARNHSRDHDMHDLVQKNPAEEAIKNGWVKENGQTRKRVDDI